MHAVKPYWVSCTRLRWQAITVLISLQLCLLISLEPSLHSKAIYNHVATFATNGVSVLCVCVGGGCPLSCLKVRTGIQLGCRSCTSLTIEETFWIAAFRYFQNIAEVSICSTASDVPVCRNLLQKLKVWHFYYYVVLKTTEL